MNNFYDNWAQNYEETIETKKWHKFDIQCIKLLEKYNIKSIIDIGPGTGRLYNYQYGIGIRNFVFVESSEKMYSILQGKLINSADIIYEYQPSVDMISEREMNLDLLFFAYSLNHFQDFEVFTPLLKKVKFVSILLRNPDIYVLRKEINGEHFVHDNSGNTLSDYYHSIACIFNFFNIILAI